MTLDALILLLWRRWWVMLLCALLGVGTAVGVTMAMTRIYTATAVSFVSAVPAPDKGASYESAQFAVSRAKSYPPLLRSPEVLKPVIAELGLAMPVGDLARSVSADNPVDTLLVVVKAEATDPDQAAKIANSAASHMASRIRALETGGGKRPSPVDIQLAVPASSPDAPSSPRPMVNYVLGGITGTVLGAFLVLAANAIQRSKRAHEASRQAAPTRDGAGPRGRESTLPVPGPSELPRTTTSTVTTPTAFPSAVAVQSFPPEGLTSGSARAGITR